MKQQVLSMSDNYNDGVKQILALCQHLNTSLESSVSTAVTMLKSIKSSS